MKRSWQIYDCIVFPVNDRKVLQDEVGTTITQEARLRLRNEC